MAMSSSSLSANDIARRFYQQRTRDHWLTARQTAWLLGVAGQEGRHGGRFETEYGERVCWSVSRLASTGSGYFQTRKYDERGELL